MIRLISLVRTSQKLARAYESVPQSCDKIGYSTGPDLHLREECEKCVDCFRLNGTYFNRIFLPEVLVVICIGIAALN